MTPIENIKDFNEGDKLEIFGEKFEIVKIQKEADPDRTKDPPIRIYLSLELHRFGQKELIPNCFIKIYEDCRKIVFINSKKITKQDIKKL